MLKKIAILSLFVLGINVMALEPSSHGSNTQKNVKKKKTLSGKNLVVFVSNGDLQVVGMGFGIALSGVKQGANVTIVIGANAIKYALKEGDQNIYFAKGRTPRDLLKDAIKHGATVQMCSANTEEMNLDEDDFVDGVKTVISTEIFAKVFEKETRVISF
jgi:predicted peroxiredoxin